MNRRRAAELGGRLAEHVAAGIARLAGRRYFDGAYFDRVYADADPWGYAASPYEAARREAVLAALPRQRYRSILEVGCGEGHTTRRLAERGDRVVGLDISDRAVARAVELPANVRVARGDLLAPTLPPEAPAGAFDLVVCAEVLYYCYPFPFGRTSRLVRDRIVAWLAPGGDLVLEHPRHTLAHRPFDRLVGATLVTLERRRVALPPRPVAIAVYRRREGAVRA